MKNNEKTITLSFQTISMTIDSVWHGSYTVDVDGTTATTSIEGAFGRGWLDELIETINAEMSNEFVDLDYTDEIEEAVSLRSEVDFVG